MKKMRKKWRRNAVLGFVSMLALAGCAGTMPPDVVTKIQVERVTVPGDLLTLPAPPTVPVNPTLQSQVADYIVRLKVDDDVCRADVAAVAATQK